MLASLAAKAVTAVTSPIKSVFAYSPAPPSPAPRPPLLDAAETRLGKRSQREESVESALTELSEDGGHGADAVEPEERASSAKKPRLAVKEDVNEGQQQLPTPSPSRSSGSSEPAAFEAAPPKRARTTRAGKADGEDEEDDPSLGKDGKHYYVAGLYWSSDVPVQKRSSSAASEDVEISESGARNWRSIVPSRSTALPPPIHHAITLLSPSIDDDGPTPFRLPFDILRDFWFVEEAKNRKGKGRVGESAAAAKARREGKGGVKTTEEDIEKREKSKKPEPHRYIGKNVYVGRGPDKAPIPAICACTPPKRPGEMGCGVDCINRLMQYCCDPKLCPCGPDKCANPPLNKREGIPEGKDGLRVIWASTFSRESKLMGISEHLAQTGNRGFGLKTMVPIKQGDFVIEYRGEIISRDESYRRVLTTYADKTSYYFMDYDGHEVVDAGQRGNAARFINHSCGPNLEVVRWRLAGVEEYQMGLFALHDIPAGTELTYDYGWQDFAALAPPTLPSTNLLPTPAPTSTSTTPTPTTTTASATNESTILLSTGTAIDPSHQRCYCGAAECSGFLGGRAKGKSKKKGKAKLSVEAKEEEQEEGRKELGFVQAKIRVVDHARRASVGGTPMRSGREAARRANEKLVGSA
ncbi:Histone-lysine N-methyltransferase ASH1L [Rhodotorula toruloides]|nr:Histone-lysine N-methyltransferase ASH1L [Rhodotorula toruloides]